MPSKKDWWKEAFQKAYFDIWDSFLTPERTVKEASFVIKKLGLKKGDKLLDAPCGQGRHAVFFTEAGLQVTGIDYSAFLLKKARERCSDLHPKPVFFRQDMRRLSFDKKFDAVVNIFTSFGFFSDKDNEKVIDQYAKVLRKGGTLFLDLPNVTRLLSGYEKKPKKEWFETSGGKLLDEIVSFDPKTFRANLRWVMVKNNHKEIHEGAIRFYTVPELDIIFSKAGFSIDKIYGNFDGSSFDFFSPRLILIAKKVAS